MSWQVWVKYKKRQFTICYGVCVCVWVGGWVQAFVYVCVCVCVCVRARAGALARVCFDCGLVLCFIMG